MKKVVQTCMSLVVVFLLSASVVHAASLLIEPAAQGTGTASIILKNSGDVALAAFSCAVKYNHSGTAAPVVALGPAAEAAGKKIIGLKADAGMLRFSVAGMNNAAIADGVVATIEFPGMGASEDGAQLVSAQGSTPDGKPVSLGR